MPSQEHELLAEMFRLQPALAVDLLQALDFPVPKYDDAIVSSGELNDVTPTEYRADRVVTYTAEKKTVFAVIVEVQLRQDGHKRFSWPAYVGTLYCRLKCPLLLVVVCLDAKVADWCGKPVVIADPSFFRMAPVVVGPAQMPVVTDVALAERAPELAVLSTLSHGDEPEPQPLFTAFLAALGKVNKDRADLYYDFVLAFLPREARTLLEDLVTTSGYEYKSDFARRYFSAGKTEGVAEGEARSVLRVLATRGVEVPADVRAKISACADTDLLDTWLSRAVTATEVSELFD